MKIIIITICILFGYQHFYNHNKTNFNSIEKIANYDLKDEMNELKTNFTFNKK